MRILSVLLSLAFTATASAQSNTISGMFGFNRGEVGFGAQFEHEIDRGLGIGGYFHMAGEDEDNQVPEVISFAANTKVHFNPISDKVSFHVAPGFGVHMYELGTFDETIVGPSLQWGMLFHLSNKASMGLENLVIYNWFEEELSGSTAEYLNLIFSFDI